jgi:4-alpha-glucanotransferase
MPAEPSAPFFNWLDHRAAGVLLHPTSFPGDFGVGTLGSEARSFLDFLAESGIRYWQVCPLGPTGYGDSPYQSVSVYAGNPYLIDLLELTKAGILPSETLGPLLFLPSDHVDYGALYRLKWPILRQAFAGFQGKSKTAITQLYGDFERFKATHVDWLDSFVFYQALKQTFGGAPWYEWPEDCRTYARFLASDRRTPELEEEAEAQRFYQYVFFGQWKRLRRYGKERKIGIIGDIPIFVSPDSADVWAHPEVFQIDQTDLQPRAVAGVPPDYFSADGQYWGNPLFDWTELEQTDFSWWKKRLQANFELYDIIRIDHFRGFEAYWSIPFGSPTAKSGTWVHAPGLAFFKAVRQAFPDARIIAEDLGSLSSEVYELLEATGLPGMAVLQFAFGGKADNFYLPHNLKQNSVIYPGTHDNDTTVGWYHSADELIQDHARRYFRISGQEISWDFIRAAYQSVSRLAIVTVQDLLSLDSSGRFNTPGSEQGNWQWRYSAAQLSRLHQQSAGYLRNLARLYGRIEEDESKPLV